MPPIVNSNIRKAIIFSLSIIFILLLGLHLYFSMDQHGSLLNDEDWGFRKFNFGKEKNFPSIYSSLLLLGASASLMFTHFRYRIKASSKYLWITLSLVFLFLSLDELLRIHEKLGGSIKHLFPDTGLFYYTWVIPYVIALAILLFAITKPLFRLPKKTIYGFILSGVVFVGGAVGMEIVSGLYIKNSGMPLEIAENSLPVYIFYTIEESLEMIGVILFIYYILSYNPLAKPKG